MRVDLSRRIIAARMAEIGASSPLARASGKDGCPCFADLDHHNLRPGEPPFSLGMVK